MLYQNENAGFEGDGAMSRDLGSVVVEAVPEKDPGDGSDIFRVRFPGGAVGRLTAEQFERAFIPISWSAGDNLAKHALAGVDRFMSSQLIAKKEVRTMGDNTTVMRVELKNGTVFVEYSTSHGVDDYDIEKGKVVCMKRVEGHIWRGLSFMLLMAANTDF